jgi:hypothetical protein
MEENHDFNIPREAIKPAPGDIIAFNNIRIQSDFCYTSDVILEDDWNDRHYPSKIPLFPFAARWDLILLFAFVNNVPGEFQNVGFRVRNEFSINFTFKHPVTQYQMQIQVDVRKMLISVKMERPLLLQSFSTIYIDFKTNLKTRNRISLKPCRVKRFLLFLFHQMNRERGTQYILSHERNIKCTKSDFSEFVITLAHHITDRAYETLPFAQYFQLKLCYELEFLYRAVEKQCFSNSFDHFLDSRSGFFYITVTEYKQHDRFWI